MDPTLYLVPLFMFDGSATLVQEFYPLPMETVELCEESRPSIDEFLNDIDHPPGWEFLGTMCGTVEEVQDAIEQLNSGTPFDEISADSTTPITGDKFL